MKTSYSIKKVLKRLFKPNKPAKQTKQQIYNSLESLESLDNLRNSQIEEVYYEEIEDNTANEKLAVMQQEEEIYVPVRFARTAVGTFFWTTNLEPVTGTIRPITDYDLLQPAHCYTKQQYPSMQYQDRWAQA